MEIRENPFTKSIRLHSDLTKVSDLLSHPTTFIPGLILCLVQFIVVGISAVFWPYGFVFVFADLVLQFVESTWNAMREADGVAEAAAFALSLLIYLVLFVPVGLLCLPGLIPIGIVALAAAMWDNAETTWTILGWTLLLCAAFALIATVIGFIIVNAKAILGIFLLAFFLWVAGSGK